MSCTAETEINMANSVKPSDIDVFLSDKAWAIHSTYHTVLNASPGAAMFGGDMFFNILFIADRKKMENLGNYKQNLILLKKTKVESIMITRLVKKYMYRTMVYSAKENPGI
jgi:hypothetical protein